MAILDKSKYSVPTEEDMSLAGESSRKLARCLTRGDRSGASISVLNDDETSETIAVPEGAFRLFIEMLDHMSQGHIVTLYPIHAELTTQEAADLLGVSRPFLVKQLESDEIPYRKIGKHRRIQFQDLMAYKHRIDEARNQSLDELVALDQELGLGYD
jgi:excisionase family DNA binding protein